jgi:hypothetical protein
MYLARWKKINRISLTIFVWNVYEYNIVYATNGYFIISVFRISRNDFDFAHLTLGVNNQTNQTRK